jgi:hypothetical protein
VNVQKVIREALSEMWAEASNMRITTGVAAVLVWKDQEEFPAIHFCTMDSIERDPDPKRKPNDTGTNYLAVAIAKIAKMTSTHRDSGKTPRPLKKGEWPWCGGLTCRKIGYDLYVAFSGGTEDQDTTIAHVGMDILLTQF